MILRLVLVLVVACPLLAVPARVAYSEGQTADATDVTTPAIDSTGATLLLVKIVTNNTLATATITDSRGNTWHALTEYGSGSQFLRVYYAYDHGGSALSVGASHTATVAGGWNKAVEFSAYSGTLSTGDPLDQSAGASANGMTVQPGSITPTVNGCLLIVAYSSESASASSINSSFTLVDYIQNANVGLVVGFAELVQTTAAAVNPTLSMSGWTNHRATIMSFKPGATASPRRKTMVVFQ